MKLTCVVALLLALGGAASAQPMSRADHMKTCANQWKAKKASAQAQGLKYQKFMSDCLKAVAAKRPAHA